MGPLQVLPRGHLHRLPHKIFDPPDGRGEHRARACTSLCLNEVMDGREEGEGEPASFKPECPMCKSQMRSTNPSRALHLHEDDEGRTCLYCPGGESRPISGQSI